eukprot:2483096-Prorocentrum_lima.AAC.1
MQPEERQSLKSLVRGARMPGARALHTSLPKPSGPGARRGFRSERRENLLLINPRRGEPIERVLEPIGVPLK